jgi:DNA invertase Pin-like site-specific DNA recombinase
VHFVDLCGYLRVSSESQLDGYGLDAQRKAIRAWAKANGHRIVHWCADEGRSGALDVSERAGLACAVEAVKSGASRGVVVARLDRLARSLTVQEGILAVLWRNGGSVFTADTGELRPDDPDDPMRTAVRQVVGVFAQLDRAMVVKRLRDGRTAKASTGRKAVGAYAYGYRGHGKGRERDATPEPTEQEAVRMIVELRRSGKSYREIVAALEAEGHRPRRADRWSPMSVRNIACREVESSAA